MGRGLRTCWKLSLGAFLFGVLLLAYLGYRYRGHVSSAFGFISEETGGTAMAVLTIILSICGLMYGAFCLVFPILAYFGLKDLRRRIAAIQTTQIVATRSCEPKEPAISEKSGEL